MTTPSCIYYFSPSLYFVEYLHSFTVRRLFLSWNISAIRIYAVSLQKIFLFAFEWNVLPCMSPFLKDLEFWGFSSLFLWKSQQSTADQDFSSSNCSLEIKTDLPITWHFILLVVRTRDPEQEVLGLATQQLLPSAGQEAAPSHCHVICPNTRAEYAMIVL